MEPEDRLRTGVGEGAFFEHEFGAAPLSRRRAFLRRLEDEEHRAGEFAAEPGEHRRDAVLHRGVDIVSAGVHHADFLVVVGGAHFGGEGQVGVFGHREGVHVGAHRDHRPRTAAAQHADDAGVRDLLPHFVEAERPQVLGDPPRRLEFPVPQFGELVDVLAESDGLLFVDGDRFADAVVPVAGLLRGGERGGGGQEQRSEKRGGGGTIHRRRSPLEGHRVYRAAAGC